MAVRAALSRARRAGERESRCDARTHTAQAQEALDKSRFLFIQGTPSSGKTVVTLNLAYEWTEGGKTVLYFGRPALLSDEFFQYLSTPEASRLLDKKGTVIVVDDVHLDPARASRLFNFVYANLIRLGLLFVSRPLRTETEDLTNTEHYAFAQYMPALTIRAEAVAEALANHYSLKQYAKPIPAQILKAFIEECGNDLLLLGRYIRQWNGQQSIHLPDVRRRVFQSVRDDLERLRAGSADSVKALFIVSLFYRYEVPVERKFLDKTLSLSLENLLKTGEISEQNGFALLHHSSMAKLYTNVCRSLRMPEMAELEHTFPKVPNSIFSQYIQSRPRNLCELVIGLRRSKDILSELLSEAECIAPIRAGIERESDLNQVGWAMLAIYSASRKNGWQILKDVDLAAATRESLPTSAPSEIGRFIFNLYRISRTKGGEWVNGVSPKVLASAIQRMPLNHAGATLQRISHFSANYARQLVLAMDPVSVCSLVQQESDYDKLHAGIHHLITTLGPMASVRAYRFQDAFGEWTTRMSFYCGTHRVTRFLRGTLRVPYGTSIPRMEKYFWFLIESGRRDCRIVVDAGAELALERNKSLFPVGVSSVHGEFSRGDVVFLFGLQGNTLGAGVANFSSAELWQVAGLRSGETLEKTGIAPNRVMDNDLAAVGRRYRELKRQLKPTLEPTDWREGAALGAEGGQLDL
jgi:hypothetical protein